MRSVSEATRRKVEAIARQLNYTVDKNASNLRFQHSNTLAVLFFEDATEASALLDLTLTSRDKGPDAMPMAGFPHHQLDPQLVKLVAAGRRVAAPSAVIDIVSGPGVFTVSPPSSGME